MAHDEPTPGPMPDPVPSPLEAFEATLVERISAQTSDDLVILGRLVDTDDTGARMRALHLVRVVADAAAEQLAELQHEPPSGSPGAGGGMAGFAGVFGEMTAVVKDMNTLPKVRDKLFEAQRVNAALRIAVGDLLDAVDKGHTERAERIRKRLQSALDNDTWNDEEILPVVPVPVPYPLTVPGEQPASPNPDIIDAADIDPSEYTP